MTTDKEKKREYDKEYREKNKEKITEYKKEYHQKNKEKVNERCKEYSKEYRKNNKEKISQYYKEYGLTEKGKRSFTIRGWKYQGLICDDYDEMYDKYIIAENCEECEVKFEGNGRNQKCLDHDHTTGLFRNFLCKSCNNKRG
jgi:hypothetical protein